MVLLSALVTIWKASGNNIANCLGGAASDRMYQDQRTNQTHGKHGYATMRFYKLISIRLRTPPSPVTSETL